MISYPPDTTGFHPTLAWKDELQVQNTNTKLCLWVITVKKGDSIKCVASGVCMIVYESIKVGVH